MDVTPITLRDVPVSSGVGADPHGRETSQSGVQEEQVTTTQSKPKAEETAKPEYPKDPQADALAARLRMADPNMDGKTARKIAKQLLTPAPKWEMKAPAAPADAKTAHIDAKA